jgi:hypothetical protein
VTTTLPSRSFMPPTTVIPTGPAAVATGRRLGFYTAMTRLGPVTPLQLAMAADASAWFTDAWLQSQAASGHATFDPTTDRYALAANLAA